MNALVVLLAVAAVGFTVAGLYTERWGLLWPGWACYVGITAMAWAVGLRGIAMAMTICALVWLAVLAEVQPR